VCRYCTPGNAGYKDLDGKFWKNLDGKAVLYGAGVSGTLMDDDQTAWNLNNLNTLLDKISHLQFDGINTPYLYYGS